MGSHQVRRERIPLSSIPLIDPLPSFLFRGVWRIRRFIPVTMRGFGRFRILVQERCGIGLESDKDRPLLALSFPKNRAHGYSSSLVKKDEAEVCSLSYGLMLPFFSVDSTPVLPLQGGVLFSAIVSPQRQQRSLRSAYHKDSVTGLPCFAFATQVS